MEKKYVNAKNKNAKGLARSWNQAKVLMEKVGVACARAESKYEAPRKPNPSGRPRYRVSLVTL